MVNGEGRSIDLQEMWHGSNMSGARGILDRGIRPGVTNTEGAAQEGLSAFERTTHRNRCFQFMTHEHAARVPSTFVFGVCWQVLADARRSRIGKDDVIYQKADSVARIGMVFNACNVFRAWDHADKACDWLRVNNETLRAYEDSDHPDVIYEDALTLQTLRYHLRCKHGWNKASEAKFIYMDANQRRRIKKAPQKHGEQPDYIAYSPKTGAFYAKDYEMHER